MAEHFDKIFKQLYDDIFGQSASDPQLPVAVDKGCVLLVELSSIVRMAVIHNGKAQPVAMRAREYYSAPLWVGITGYDILFGDFALHAKGLSGTPKSYCHYYDLAESFQYRNTKPPGPFKFVHKEIMADHRRCEEVSLEFLLALFIRHLKNIAVERQGIKKESMKKLLIVIPLWFSSLLRQSCIDAGRIAGFETVTIMNQTTALSLFHLGGRFLDEPLKSSAWTSSKRSLLVLSECADNVDAVIYDYWRDPTGRKMLKMVAFFGNLYETEKTEKGVQRKLQNFYFMRSPTRLDGRKLLIEDLLKQAMKKLMDCGRSTKDLEVILYCDTISWGQIMYKVLTERFGKSVSVLETCYDSVVYAGKGVLRRDPILMMTQELPGQISELNSLTFFRRDVENSYIPDVIFKRDDKLRGEETAKSLQIGIPRSTEVVVFQTNCLETEQRIGKLHMSRLLYYLFAEIGTSFVLNKDGILNFSHVFGITNKGDIEIVSDEHIKWDCAYLKRDEIERYQELLNDVFARYKSR